MEGAAPSGLREGIRAIAASLLDLASTRLELASVEIEEERLRLASLMLCAVAALFFLALGIVLASLLVVLLCWNGPREWALGSLALLHLSLGSFAAWEWHRQRRSKPPLLGATIAEFRRDRAAIGG